VTQADKSYKDIIRAGSVTDLGRVFLMLGLRPRRAGLALHLLDYEPSEINGIKEKLTFSFAPVETGILLRCPKTFETYVAATRRRAASAGRSRSSCPAGRGRSGPGPGQGARRGHLSETQRQIPILDAIAAKGGGPTDVPFQVTNDFYAAVDGSTLVVTTSRCRATPHTQRRSGNLRFGRLRRRRGTAGCSI